MESEGSSPRSQGLANSCPEPDRFFYVHLSKYGGFRIVALIFTVSSSQHLTQS
jgi:hypothetical protein